MQCGGHIGYSPYIMACTKCMELQHYKSECIRLRDLLNEANLRIKHYKVLLNEKTDSDSESDSESGDQDSDDQDS